MRTAVALLLCLPMLLPPGVCACGARPQTRSAPKCGCCRNAAPKPCPAKPDRLASQPRPHDDHAPACPAHPAAGVRFAKSVLPIPPVDTAAVSPAQVFRLPLAVSVLCQPVPPGGAHSDPPLYLLDCAFRC